MFAWYAQPLGSGKNESNQPAGIDYFRRDSQPQFG